MTPNPGESSSVTLTRTVHDVLVGSALDEDARAIAQQIRDQNLSMLLPEQEWCEDCSRDIDAAAEPGMPQDVVERSIEPLTLPPDWDPDWGPAPLYDVAYLACGHTLAHLAS